jgi:CHAT domain-containing protein
MSARLVRTIIGFVAVLVTADGLISGMFSAPAPGLPQTALEELVTGSTYEGVLQKPLPRRFHFALESNQYIALELEAPMGLRLVLANTYGQILRSAGCTEQGPWKISEVAQKTSQYILELLACGEDLPETRYQLKVSQLRASTQRERLEVKAARLEEEADNLSWEYLADTRTKALGQYEASIQTWRLLGNHPGELRTLVKASRLSLDLAQKEKAMVFLNQALALLKQQKNPAGEAKSLLTLAAISWRSGDSMAALNYCARAKEIGDSTGDRDIEAEAAYVMGDVYFESGDLNGAAGAYQTAYSTWSDVNNRLGRARSLVALAEILSARSEFEQARQNSAEAKSIFKSLGDKQGQARSITVLGNIQYRTGYKQEALDLYQQARALLQDSGDLLAQAILLGGLARTHEELGDNNSAIQYFKLALSQYRTLNYRAAEAQALRAVGEYYLSLGDGTNALRNLQEAVNASRALGNQSEQARCLRDIGFVYDSLGETDRAIEYFNQALELNRSAPDRRLESSTLIGLGRIRERRRNFIGALEQYRRALDLSRSSEDRFGELAALYGIVSCLRGLDRLGEALEASETAIKAIEKLRATVAGTGLRTNYFSSVKQHYDLQIDLLMRLANNEVGSSAQIRAFEKSEASRARSLLDSIREARNSISDGVDRASFEREVSLRTQLDTKSEKYTQLLSVNSDSKEIAALGREIQTLNAEYDELLGQIKLSSPHYAALLHPQPLTAQQIQDAVLDADSILLEYSLGEENSYLWAVTRQDFSSFALPRRSEIEKKVRRFREVITARGEPQGKNDLRFQIKDIETQYPKLAAELGEILLGPVADKLAGRRLLIVADGVLQYLPFGALAAPQSAQTSTFTPLLMEHEIVNLPSASTLAVIRQEAPDRDKPDRTLAIFADPVFQSTDPRVRKNQAASSTAKSQPARTSQQTKAVANLNRTLRSDLKGGSAFPRLFSTRMEAESIVAMVPEDGRFVALDFDATKAAVMNPDLRRYRIVHFATHTILNEDHQDLSSLVMSLVDERGNPQGGFLRLRDMYSLHLDAELVVLSACETGLGKEVKGEGLMSMVRGFMYSGTPRVLASLWKIDDEATAELMKEFYTQLLQKGLTPAAALRQAQITQMQKKSRQSPYYWAGFQLQGEWK